MHTIDIKPESYDTFLWLIDMLASQEYVVEIRGETVQLSSVDYNYSISMDEVKFTAYENGDRKGGLRRIPLDQLRRVVIV